MQMVYVMLHLFRLKYTVFDAKEQYFDEPVWFLY